MWRVKTNSSFFQVRSDGFQSLYIREGTIIFVEANSLILDSNNKAKLSLLKFGGLPLSYLCTKIYILDSRSKAYIKLERLLIRFS